VVQSMPSIGILLDGESCDKGGCAALPALELASSKSAHDSDCFDLHWQLLREQMGSIMSELAIVRQNQSNLSESLACVQGAGVTAFKSTVSELGIALDEERRCRAVLHQSLQMEADDRIIAQSELERSCLDIRAAVDELGSSFQEFTSYRNLQQDGSQKPSQDMLQSCLEQERQVRDASNSAIQSLLIEVRDDQSKRLDSLKAEHDAFERVLCDSSGGDGCRAWEESHNRLMTTIEEDRAKRDFEQIALRQKLDEQSIVAHCLSERLDSHTAREKQGREASQAASMEHLQQLNTRLSDHAATADERFLQEQSERELLRASLNRRLDCFFTSLHGRLNDHAATIEHGLARDQTERDVLHVPLLSSRTTGCTTHRGCEDEPSTFTADLKESGLDIIERRDDDGVVRAEGDGREDGSRRLLAAMDTHVNNLSAAITSYSISPGAATQSQDPFGAEVFRARGKSCLFTATSVRTASPPPSVGGVDASTRKSSTSAPSRSLSPSTLALRSMLSVAPASVPGPMPRNSSPLSHRMSTPSMPSGLVASNMLSGHGTPQLTQRAHHSGSTTPQLTQRSQLALSGCSSASVSSWQTTAPSQFSCTSAQRVLSGMSPVLSAATLSQSETMLDFHRRTM